MSFTRAIVKCYLILHSYLAHHSDIIHEFPDSPVADVVSHCTPIVSPISGECRMSDLYIQIHIDDPQEFHSCMEFKREEYQITF